MPPVSLWFSWPEVWVRGAYAYTSPEVTQDSLLYPIKEKLENIEEKIQITPGSKKQNFILKISPIEAEFESVQKKKAMSKKKKLLINK